MINHVFEEEKYYDQITLTDHLYIKKKKNPIRIIAELPGRGYWGGFGHRDIIPWLWLHSTTTV